MDWSVGSVVFLSEMGADWWREMAFVEQLGLHWGKYSASRFGGLCRGFWWSVTTAKESIVV